MTAADPMIDGFMRDLKLSQIRAVRLLYLHGSLSKAAEMSGEPLNSVKNQLKKVDEWFRRNLDAPLYEQKSDHSFELTDNGAEIGRQYQRLEAVFQDIFDGLTSSSVNIRIPCTSDCVTFLARVVKMMPSGSREIIPFTINTSDFNPFFSGEARRPVLSLGSLYCKNSRLDLPPGVEHLVLRNDPIVAIANEDLNAHISNSTSGTGPPKLDASMDVAKLLNSGVRILMPEGGVVWDFMNENAPSRNWGLEEGRHLKVHDLSYGLKVLASGVVRRGVMLVHGIDNALEEGSEKYPKLKNFHRYQIAESTGQTGRAVTALFYNTRAASQRVPAFAEACAVFWETAKQVLPLSSSSDPPQTVGFKSNRAPRETK